MRQPLPASAPFASQERDARLSSLFDIKYEAGLTSGCHVKVDPILQHYLERGPSREIFLTIEFTFARKSCQLSLIDHVKQLLCYAVNLEYHCSWTILHF
jgi:hypothetical protein